MLTQLINKNNEQYLHISLKNCTILTFKQKMDMIHFFNLYILSHTENPKSM